MWVYGRPLHKLHFRDISVTLPPPGDDELESTQWRCEDSQPSKQKEIFHNAPEVVKSAVKREWALDGQSSVELDAD